MNPRLKSLFYLSPGDDAFWCWSDDASVATWSDGGTLVFKAELKAHLRRFLGRGLPPLPCFLLLLAAMRNSWSVRSLQLLKNLDGMPAQQATVRMLDRVHHASRGHCDTLESRASLLFLVMDGIPSSVTSDVAKDVIEQIDQGFAETIRLQLASSPLVPKPESGRQSLRRALEAMHPALEGFSTQSLNLLRETGVAEVPHPIPDTDLSDALKARALLKSLRQEQSNPQQQDLTQIADLATRLMGIVSLPRKLDHGDQQPVGGISDISNRGNLDRLLLTELAHDDLTLAVRVATNEAMYLRRESPPAKPMLQRTVLLDAGIRTWGVPRLYITAIGLALQATSDRHVPLVVRSLTEHAALEADFTTREGVVSHLSQLSPHLHPDRAWDEQLSRWQTHDEPEATPVLVTTPDTMQDEGFLPKLRPYLGRGLLVATVDREGEFELREWTLQGSKRLRAAHVEIQDVVPQSPSMVDEEAKSWMPAIDRAMVFPLLLAPEIDPESCWPVQGVGVFQVTKDRRLLFRHHVARGAQQLAQGVGRLCWASSRVIDGMVYAICRLNATVYQLFRIPRPATLTQPADPQISQGAPIRLDDVRVTEFELDGVEFFFEHDGQLFACGKAEVARLSLEDGTSLQSTYVPDRFYWQKNVPNRFAYTFEKTNLAWYAVSSDSQGISLEEVPVVASLRVQHIFQLPGDERILGLTHAQDVVDVETGHVVESPRQQLPGWRFEGMSRSGRNLLFTVNGGLKYVSLNAESKTRAIFPGGKRGQRLPEPEVRSMLRARSLRTRLFSVGLCPGVGLILESKRRRWLALRRDQGILKITAQTEAVRRSCVTKFTATPESQQRPYLKVAKLPGGQVFLDQRGLLHLKSDDGSIPEVSLVLHDDHVAGWLSTGEVFGPEFFHGRSDAIGGAEVYAKAIAPFMQHCTEVMNER